MSEHPNAALARAGFRAFAEGDAVTIANLIADDAVWRIPGRSLFAGEYRGRDAILGMLRETRARTGGTYTTRLHYAVADDEHVVAVYRASGEREGRQLDIDQALVCRVAAGRWVEVEALPSDLYAFDEFWS